MNIKMSVIFFVLVLSGQVFAQEAPENDDVPRPTVQQCERFPRAQGCEQGSASARQQQQNLTMYTNCKPSLDNARLALDNARQFLPIEGREAAISGAQRTLNSQTNCRAYEIASIAAKNGNAASINSERTADGKATCIQRAGYTFDYKSCTAAIGLYNTITMLEAGMLQTQNMRLQNNQQNISSTVASRNAQGDGQNAAMDASIADNKFKANLSMEQATAYFAAVAALGAKITSWQKKDDESLKKLCVGVNVPPTQDVTTMPGVECVNAVIIARDSGAEAFANDNAKGFFTTAAMNYATKAAQAMAAARRMNEMANAVQKAQDNNPNNPNQPTLDRCVTSPLDPACITATTTTPGSTFTPGDFNAGDGFGNNSFGGTNGDETFGEAGEETNVPDGANVAGVTSPFENEAKEASGILNPAAAAKTTPTGGAGGGGGGAGGGLGGGGVSLGNDLDGADKENKTAEIKSNKVGGSYASAGGKGFSAVAGRKEDANPFASLFGGKSEGGVEEDRSIASGDIDGKSSGLFQKISHRYELIQADKRIEMVSEDK